MANQPQGKLTVASAHLTAASALAQRIKDTVLIITAIIKSCKDKYDCGLLQPAVDEIVQVCLKIDLAYKKNVLGRNCGIHPENRSKAGVDPFNAQNLALIISQQGYSESKLESPNGFRKSRTGTGCISPERIHVKELRHGQRLS